MTSTSQRNPTSEPVVGTGADRLELVASAEPAVVFASLAEQCAEAVCDACSIELDADGATHRIAWPAPDAVPDAADAAAARLALDFADPTRTRYRGVAVFAWRDRDPTPGERLLAGVLVDHATRTVEWQRVERAAREAATRAANLDVALQSSRRIGAAIGILMSLHKITEDEAFDRLRLVSHRTHRKLREVALEVTETGWLDPAAYAVEPVPTTVPSRLDQGTPTVDPAAALRDHGRSRG